MGVGTRGVHTRAAASVFEIPIDLGQPADVLRAITGWAASASGTRGRKRVMYANAHVLNQSVEVPALRRILGDADLVYCDGYGVRVAARALGVEEPHRMTGADWVWGLASICEADGISLYLLGSEPGAAREAASRLRRWHPDLDVVGAHHGYFEADTPHNDRVLEDINASRPNILLVGMGSPKQELSVDRYADRLDVDSVRDFRASGGGVRRGR
jgi:N-acetylglucosaminyldiphosphoundecaprenol N-acetyl-beta-D-mannosaminyltransferase